MKKSIALLVVALFAVVISASGIIYFKAEGSRGNPGNIEFPKGSSYDDVWKDVAEFENKGLPKSALELVNAIYSKAKEDNNHAQLIKAIIFQQKYKMYVDEEANKKVIIDLQAEIDSSSFPVKPVLQSMLAELYWMYYQNNRWRYYNRTEVAGFNPQDIATWDVKKIVDASIKYHLAALENADSLKRTDIDIYKEILIYYGTTKNLRPTLYDFLAHRAVDFFMSSEPDVSRPATNFSIDSRDFFASSKEFISMQLISTDTLSTRYHAMSILQNLLDFHAKDKSPEAFYDIDLKRLQLVWQNSVLSEKDSLYLIALENMRKDAGKNPVQTEIAYAIASVHFNKGNSYQPLISDENKWKLKEAHDICQEALRKYPDSPGSQNCRYLMSEIKRKQFSFTLEDFEMPDSPAKALVSFKNTSGMHFRAVKLDRRKHRNDTRNLYSEDFIKYITKLKPNHSWVQKLPLDGDYQTHTIEIELPELQYGYYIIIASNNESFSLDSNAVFYAYTTRTNLSYVQRKNADESYDFVVMDRKSGKPLENISSTVWLEEYNYLLQKYVYKQGPSFKTNEDGFINIGAPSDYRTFFMEFKNGDDNLFTNESFYQYDPYSYNENNIVTYFYTDRAIYRPGQTVHFKGIVLSTDGENNKIVPGFRSTVTFYDANYQKVADVGLVSNEYGTISGTFVTPEGVMNGQMHIENSYGSYYFSVEEYKRPKFEVEFKPVTESYKLNESVSLTGNAKAYAGAGIDGAAVSYTVTRSVYYPYRWWYFDWFYPSSGATTVIKNGSCITDENGDFKVDFVAVPDASVSKKWNPAFMYSITADVTDINGETHSSTQTINVGYQSLVISTDLAERVNMKNADKILITTSNLSGEFVAAECLITITQLKTPQNYFVKRKWTRPDLYLLTENEFKSKYPFEVYKDEDNPQYLEKVKEVYRKTVTTVKDEKVKISGTAPWQQGKYLIEIETVDKFGEKVKFQKYYTVFDENSAAIAAPDLSWFVPVKDRCEPGEKAVFLVGSPAADADILFEIEHKGEIISRKRIEVNKGQTRIEVPIEEKHRGNLAVHFVYIKNNNVFSSDFSISVPYTNKELNIAFSTFRDKLYPGQNEEWILTVLGKDGEKVAAEMVATLYDASLDAFKPHNWGFSIYPYYWSQRNWYGSGSFAASGSQLYDYYWNPYVYPTSKYYDALNWFGFYYGGYYGYYDYMPVSRSVAFSGDDGRYDMEEMELDQSMADMPAMEKSKKAEDISGDTFGLKGLAEQPASPPKSGKDFKNDKTTGESANVQIRKNFSETAFFYPHLTTNEKGEVQIKFTIPEALTKWKMLGFAHTKDLKYGIVDNELITQKDLMVMPNIPRFLRENDRIAITSKIVNVSEKDLSGTVSLELFDALTLKPVNDLLGNKKVDVSFSTKKGQSAVASWEIAVPEGIQAVTFRIVAKAGKFSDGEENTVPVLSNRMLVTESLPLPIRGGESKTFEFTKLLNSASSNTLKHHKVTLEFTPNPVWYAVQALPYLIEYPYECTEQVFSRFYANSLASHIANSDPKIKRVFDSWKNIPNSEALLSNLEKNQELKAVMLEETPWVLDAMDESQRKRRVGLLFDLNHMANNIGSAIRKLERMQSANGGWVWFKGMEEDRYMTQHIVTGLAHLDHMGVSSIRNDGRIWNMVTKGVNYLDGAIRKDYEWIKKHYNKDEMEQNHLSYIQIQYLYARSYFINDFEISGRDKEAFNYFKGQAEKYWLDNSIYMQGMIALALNRYGNTEKANEIIASIKEHSLSSDEMGMYWRQLSGYYWYEAPIERQALLIEAFDEITGNQDDVNNMRVWLLKQKQTQDWKTTKATTEAIYALLLRGSSWLATESGVEIKVNNQKIEPEKMENVSVEPGTGYFKVNWSGSDIKPEMGKIEVKKTDEGVSWGAMYWQYFEQLDKITPHETPLKIKKDLFVERKTDSGKQLEMVDEKNLEVGDKIIVRIELRVDRDMEYVHMKDMRASGLEPINVLSTYKYQDGLGYYESTRDAATNFFFSYLSKGTYVFEYPLRVTHNGDFSNGITTIQCMYAPEFTSHSAGVRVEVR